VPVPEVHLLCQDESIVGTPFYVMEHVKGRIFRDPTIPEARDADERAAFFEGMIDTLARIHLVDWDAMGLADFGKPGNYMARQTGRWSKQYMASKTDDIESMDRLMDWLAENVPDDETTSIVHGDFRLENMIVHPTEPRVIAVLDWELSTLGHPWLTLPTVVWATTSQPVTTRNSATWESILKPPVFPRKMPLWIPIAGGQGGRISRIGISTSLSACSGSLPLFREFTNGVWMEMPVLRMPTRTEKWSKVWRM